MMDFTSDDISTIAQAMAWGTEALRATSETPRLDAEVLLAHILGWGRARVLAEGRQPLREAQHTKFRDLVARRVALEPVAYLVGNKEFYGLDLEVNRAVLVPRPETELLVDLALQVAARVPASAARASPLIADVGTGSGCIAVALAVHLPGALVYATDVAADALQVAGRNAARPGVEGRVRLIEGDLLAALPEPVDLLISNPPYTILEQISAGVRRHEPHLALDGGPDGLVVYRRLLAQAPAKLRPGGIVLLEIGATQGAAVAQLGRAHFPDARISVHQDLAGLDRVVAIDTGHG